MVNLWLTKSNPIDQLMDMYTWFWIQGWFMPYYIIGKQDEWKDWVGSSLDGWGINSICKQ